MNLYTINTGLFKLDGGAMFGIVPKTIWNKLNPADANNLCTWAMRCLLIEDDNKLILIDTGIGDKQNEKFFGHYDLDRSETLEKSIKKHGFGMSDITDVLLTHLHFDHVGGAVKWNDTKDNYECTFPNAIYHTFEEHWNHANNSNIREQASFLKENFKPIEASGQLNLIKEDNHQFNDTILLKAYHGHTQWMMAPEINISETKNLIYCADVIPSAYHINPVYGMAYDIQPMLTIEERKKLTDVAVEKQQVLFYEHDPINECSLLESTEKGNKHKNLFNLSDWI